MIQWSLPRLKECRTVHEMGALLEEWGSGMTCHFPIFQELAGPDDSVVELGTQLAESTVGWLSTRAWSVMSYDIALDPRRFELYQHIKKLEPERWAFVWGDVNHTPVPDCDVLLIDGDHTTEQVREDLLGEQSVSRFIALHDTVSCADQVRPAIDEFLAANTNWRVYCEDKQRCGLIVLERVR